MMDGVIMAAVMIVMALLTMSGIALESGTRMGKRNGRPGPMQLPGDGRVRGEVVRQKRLLIDVVG